MGFTSHLDAIILGAGLGGIHNLHVLLELGLSVRVLERAPEIGGTWYYNQYPGCTSDTPSVLYRLYWDKEDLKTYPWPNRYLQQSEILAYLKHLVSKHDMGPHIQLNCEVTAASWNDNEHYWCVATATGQEYTARYLISAVGLFFEPIFPEIPGIDAFQGRLVHSSEWAPDIDITGKRVGVIGCGATGIQLITALAPQVSSLISFQRTPQYSIPARNGPVTPQDRAWINEHYGEIIDQVWNSITGFGFIESTRPTMSVDPEERERIFEELWRSGGNMRFMMGGFGDITTNAEANEEACRFIRKKIAETVKDPEKARKVTPTERFARRPLCDSGYYETLNRDNVQIVSCRESPITAITPTGIKTSDGTIHELDIIIFATGFDVIEGSYTRFPIFGRGGKSLMDHWRDGAKSNLGIACPGFPNLFFVNGPQGPFGNIPAVLQTTAETMTALIKEAEKARAKGGSGIVEATVEGEIEWGRRCEQMAKGSLFNEISSWITGGNVQGRKPTCRFFLGGIKLHRAAWREIRDQGWRGFHSVM